jgi:15-cis-phytoene synthase
MNATVENTATEDAVVAHSRKLIQKGSKSFAGAARLFDADTRASAYMLYAWCRHCDDEIDGQELGFNLLNAPVTSPALRLAGLTTRTVAAINGRPMPGDDRLVFEALARVVAKHKIPARHPLELIEGFRMDVAERQYQTLDDTLSYCYHVAGVVGVMMTMIMGVRERETLNRASDLGIAFQLTNIARDVIPDAIAGRVYLPLQWLAEAGVPAGDVANPQHRQAVFGVVERLLDEADRYYRSARYGLPQLPLRAAWAIAAARRIYRKIGFVVRSRGSRAWDERAYVSRRGKMAQAALGGLSIGRARASKAIKAAPTRDGLWTMPGLGQPG